MIYVFCSYIILKQIYCQIKEYILIIKTKGYYNGIYII
jgi:hypothetical protein